MKYRDPGGTPAANNSVKLEINAMRHHLAGDLPDHGSGHREINLPPIHVPPPGIGLCGLYAETAGPIGTRLR